MLKVNHVKEGKNLRVLTAVKLVSLFSLWNSRSLLATTKIPPNGSLFLLMSFQTLSYFSPSKQSVIDHFSEPCVQPSKTF